MSRIILYEGPAQETPPAGGIVLYAKIDGRLYWKGDDGVEIPFYPLGAGTGDLLSDGTVPLVANWDVGAYEITMLRGHFDTPTGQPFTVVSTDRVVNLNADTVDGFHASQMLNSATSSLVGYAIFLDEDNMASDDDTKVPSQQSVKAYVDTKFLGANIYQGGYNASTNTPDLTTSPNAILKGQYWVVSAAGTSFYSQNLEIGDTVIANQDDPSLVTHWTILQTNLDAASIKSLYESNADTNEFTDAEKAKVGALAGYQSSAGAISVAVGDRWYYTGTGHAATFPGTFARGTFNDLTILNNGGTGDLTLTPASGDKFILNGVDLGTDATYVLEPGRMALVVPDTTDTAWSVTVIGVGGGGMTVTPVKTGNYTANPNEVVPVDSSGGAFTVTLPAAGVLDPQDRVIIMDVGKACSTYTVTIGRNSNTIDGVAADFELDQNHGRWDGSYDTGNWAAHLTGTPEIVNINDFATGFGGVNAQTGTSYAFADSDLALLVTASNGSASAYTIPDGLGAIGETLNLLNIGAGTVTVSVPGTDTLGSSANDVATGKAATIVKTAATTWWLVGGA